VQQVEGVRLHVGGEREAKLQPHVRVLGSTTRRLGDGPAQVRRRALRSAPRGGPPGRLAQRRDGGRLARRLRAQQVQPDALRVGALAREHSGRVGMPERPLARRQARVQRSRDERVRERQPRCGATMRA
jgi:hypothetical protein